MENICHANTTQKKAGVLLLSRDFGAKYAQIYNYSQEISIDLSYEYITSRQKISKHTSSSVNKLDLTDIYKTLHPTTANKHCS